MSSKASESDAAGGEEEPEGMEGDKGAHGGEQEEEGRTAPGNSGHESYSTGERGGEGGREGGREGVMEGGREGGRARTAIT
jgi:hypothetical protein